MPLPTRVVVALASGTAVAALLYLRWRRQSRIASSPLRIVISGGGIGGLATALFLEELLGDAVDVLVFERSAARETDRARGSGVAINPDAHSLFTRLCGDRIPFGRRLALLQLDATGRVIREAPPSDGLRTAHWGWLAAALRDELCRRRARGARLSYEGGVAVEWCYERNVAVDWCYESGHSTSESPSSPVDVTLSDGRTVVADLLIDASGVHSPFREHVDRANTPQYAGYVIYRAQGPAPTFLQEDPPRATFGYARDFHTVSYAIPRPPGGAAAARVVTRCPCCPSAVSADDEDEAEAAERAFDPSRRWYASYVYVAQNAAQAGGLASFEDGQGECRTWGVPQGALNESSALAMARGSVPLRDAAEDDDAVRPLPEPVASLHGAVASSEAGGGPYKQAVYDYAAARLSRGRVALLGDAAHIMRPHGAKGTCLALEDALALAGALGRQHAGKAAIDVDAALAEYAAERLGPNAAAVQESMRMGEFLMNNSMGLDWTRVTAEEFASANAAAVGGEGKTAWYLKPST